MNNNTKCFFAVLVVLSFLMYLTLPLTDYVLYESQQLKNLKTIKRDKNSEESLTQDQQPIHDNSNANDERNTSGNFTEKKELKQNRKVDFHHNEEPIILIWSYLYNLSSEGPGPGKVPGGCQISNDRRDLERASAVLFEYTSLDDVSMPWQRFRHPDQVFVARFQESPRTMKMWFGVDLKKFGGNFVNWTMTYRRDADVFCPYLKWNTLKLGNPREEESKMDKILSKKSRVALWVVSNCGYGKTSGATKRMEMVDRLSKLGLKIDKFGNCFNNKEEFSRLSENQLDSYKFYVAFENSLHCRDYVTEKLWLNALSRNRVPIVWGPAREDLAELAPRGSYVFVEDFKSDEDLVEHLMYLDRNDTAYKEYFSWRTDPVWREKFDGMRLRYCQDVLCERIKEQIKEPGRRKSVEGMNLFWYGTERKECVE